MLKCGYLHIPYTDTKAVPTVLYALTTSVLRSFDCGPSVAQFVQ